MATKNRHARFRAHLSCMAKLILNISCVFGWALA